LTLHIWKTKIIIKTNIILIKIIFKKTSTIIHTNLVGVMLFFLRSSEDVKNAKDWKWKLNWRIFSELKTVFSTIIYVGSRNVRAIQICIYFLGRLRVNGPRFIKCKN
jgi:hypothetical protein